MRIETKSVPFTIKSVDADGSTFSGIAAAFNNIDHGGDIISPGAYVEHLASFRTEGKVRDEHQVTTGKILDAREVPEGLFITAKISDTAVGRDQKTLLKDGVINRLSIGHYVLERRFLESEAEVKSFWSSKGYRPSQQDLARAGNGARLITRARPIEVSTTYAPMNENCTITDVKNQLVVPAGKTFEEHGDDTLAVLEEFVSRAKDLHLKRRRESRKLSKKNSESLRSIHDAIRRLLATVDNSDEALQLFMESQKTIARSVHGLDV